MVDARLVLDTIGYDDEGGATLEKHLAAGANALEALVAGVPVELKLKSNKSTHHAPVRCILTSCCRGSSSLPVRHKPNSAKLHADCNFSNLPAADFFGADSFSYAASEMAVASGAELPALAGTWQVVAC